MSGEFGERMSLTLTATSDLSAQQYNIVHYVAPRNCDIRSLGLAHVLGPIGVLENKPVANQAATVTYLGQVRVRAGAAITAGRTFTANASGRAVTATSGSLVIGKALEAAAADGDLITAMLFPAQKYDEVVT